MESARVSGVWLWSSVIAAGGPFQGLAVPRACLRGLVHRRCLRGGLGRGRVFHTSTVRGQLRALQVPGWKVPTAKTANFHPDACVSITHEKCGVTQAPVSVEPQGPQLPHPSSSPATQASVHQAASGSGRFGPQLAPRSAGPVCSQAPFLPGGDPTPSPSCTEGDDG